MPKWFTSLGFTLRKAYWKIYTAKPSVLVIAILVLATALFILGGGIYDIISQPLPAYSYGSTILFLYPSLSGQAIVESIGVMISYSMGVSGMLLLYQSTKYAYKPRQAYMLMLAGVILIVVSYAYIERLVATKLTFGRA